jgi:hypothetical protein
MKSKEELKRFFENGDIPKQEEFWEWLESYFHKDEKIPTNKIDYDFTKKADLVDGKVPASQLPNYEHNVLNYLPLTGGIVTGNTFIKPRLAIQRTTDNSDFIAINAGVNKAVVKNPENPSEENVFIGWFKSSDLPTIGNAPYCQLNHSNARMALRTGIETRPDCTLTVYGRGYIDNVVTNTHGTSQDWKQAFEWGNHADAGYTTQSWVDSQSYTTFSFVEEKINELVIEIPNPDHFINAKNKFITVLITDDIQNEIIEWEALYPQQYISVVNISNKEITLNLQGKTFDKIESKETSEYYIDKERRLIKKGNYKESVILIH